MDVTQIQRYSVTEKTTQADQQRIISSILANMSDGTDWSVVTPPGDEKGQAISQGIFAKVMALRGTSQPNDSSLTPAPAESVNKWLPENERKNIAAQQSAEKTAQQKFGGSIGEWIMDNLANYGLIIFGIILVAGALLISQRSNVMKLVKGTGE